MALKSSWRTPLLAIIIATIASIAIAGTLGSDNIGQLSVLEIEDALQVRCDIYDHELWYVS